MSRKPIPATRIIGVVCDSPYVSGVAKLLQEISCNAAPNSCTILRLLHREDGVVPRRLWPGPPVSVRCQEEDVMAFDFEAIIIGSGFGATVVATELVNKPQFQAAGGKPKVLMLERGVWWFSPERPFPAGFVNDVDTSYPPGKTGKHPVQYWPRPDHRRGALELLYSTWANIPGGDRRNDPGSHPQPLYRYRSEERRVG